MLLLKIVFEPLSKHINKQIIDLNFIDIIIVLIVLVPSQHMICNSFSSNQPIFYGNNLTEAWALDFHIEDQLENG
jgi:hypothetical protein